MLLHLMCVTVSLFAIYFCVPGSSFFAWHPILMTLAFCFFMPQAINVFNPQSYLATAKRIAKWNIHWGFQIMTCTSALAGFYVIYLTKVQQQKEHFMSWHSWLGLTGILLAVSQQIAGLFLRFHWLTFGFVKWSTLRKNHALGACLTLSIACSAVLTGFYSDWFTRLMQDVHYSWKIILAIPPLIVLMLISQILQSVFGRSKVA